MDNAAVSNEMCCICRKLRPDRYKTCEGGCRALVAYLACIAADRVTDEARRSANAIKGRPADDD